jgi:hypothetical protein
MNTTKVYSLIIQTKPFNLINKLLTLKQNYPEKDIYIKLKT